MSAEQVFDEKGKARPKPSQETADPMHAEGPSGAAPLTKSDVTGKLDAQKLTRMQKTMGNAAVQRLLAQRSMADSAFDVDDETASSIKAKKGSGQTLDPGIANKAGGVMGQDFSNVNIHADSHSDKLSRNIGAKAFTTGNDIFFKGGAYSPKSDDGQKLIAHELTHVVQQGANTPSVQSKMSVNDPNDQYEAEADKVADTVMSQPDESAQRAFDIEEKRDDVTQRQEKEELEAKRDDAVQRAEEEEMAQPKRDDAVQLAAAPEEEMMEKRDTVQRQDELPEESL